MLPDGRRTFRSTKKKDRKEAWDLCRAWEKAAESAGRGSLTEVQARKVLNEILEAIGEGPVRNVSVREFFLNWLTGKQLSKKDTTGRICRFTWSQGGQVYCRADAGGRRTFPGRSNEARRFGRHGKTRPQTGS